MGAGDRPHDDGDPGDPPLGSQDESPSVRDIAVRLSATFPLVDAVVVEATVRTAWDSFGQATGRGRTAADRSVAPRGVPGAAGHPEHLRHGALPPGTRRRRRGRDDPPSDGRRQPPGRAGDLPEPAPGGAAHALPEAERPAGVIAPFGFALGFDRESAGLMRCRPRPRGEPVLTRPVLITVGPGGPAIAVLLPVRGPGKLLARRSRAA